MHLDQEVASSRFKIVTLIVYEGDSKRSKCTEVEKGGENCSDQKSPLLALVGATGSAQAYNNIYVSMI